MINIAKGLSFFCLGFLAALFFSFSSFFFRHGTNLAHSDSSTSSLQTAFRLSPAIRTILLPELISYLESQTAQGNPLNLQETMSKLELVVPGFAVKFGLDSNGIASILDDTEFKRIIEARRCIAINDYYNKHSNLILASNYFSLLKTVSVDYCDNKLTEEDIISVLRNISLNGSWELKKNIIFDKDLLRVFDAFAKKNESIAKTYSLFYVAVANDALDNGYNKLALSFLVESKNIFSPLPAQGKMGLKLAKLSSDSIYNVGEVNTTVAKNTTNFASVFSKFIVLSLVILIPLLIILYLLHRKHVNGMNVDYLMQRYDWGDDFSIKQAVSGHELKYDVIDTPNRNNLASQVENVTPEYENSIQQGNPKIISFHKDKHGKGTGKSTS